MTSFRGGTVVGISSTDVGEKQKFKDRFKAVNLKAPTSRRKVKPAQMLP